MKTASVYHIPVLTDEVITYLDPQPGGIYVDCTFGGGSHTRAILSAQPECTVIALDWDMVALETNAQPLLEEFPGRLQLVWGNFSQVDRHLKKIGITQVNGVLADFGTSQYQIMERPGFSFAKDTPLDMRMSPPHQRITAADILNRSSAKELGYIFREYGQEPRAYKIAQQIVDQRLKEPFKTTGQLVELIERIVPRKKGKRTIHPATKAFQALRIVVNKELDNIISFLPAALRIVAPEGRMVCISFHSLEDRLVKNFFRQTLSDDPGKLEILTTKVVTATPEELVRNPASRSAKLRAARILR